MIFQLLVALGSAQSAVLSAPPQERAVLMDLFRATAGEEWTNGNGWGSSRPVCVWHGVSCDFLDGDPNRSVVVGLSLDLNNLDGVIPENLATLEHLRFLNLFGNRLRGPFPEPLLSRWDEFRLELRAGGNSFSNIVTKATVDVAATGALCAEHEDLNYRVDFNAATQRAAFQSIRCVAGRSSSTYCLVREGTSPSLMELSRALKDLGFARFKQEYDFPFTGMTHGVYVTTAVV